MSAPRKSIDGWEDKNLGSLCSLINGFPFKPDDWGPDGKPIIRIQNLNGGSDYNHFDGKIDQKYEVDPGTMLFAWSGNRGTSFGPYVWSGPTGLLNQHIFKVIPSEGIHREWFFYALDEVKERVERDAHGASGLVHVRKSDLVKYPIALPKDPTEQTKIAEILSTVDRAIEQTEALIAKQQRLKTGLMQDLLTRGIDEHGNLRSEHTHEFKDSPLGRIPVEWEVVTLSHYVARLDAGVSVNADDTPCGSGQIGVLKTSALSKGRFISEQNKSVIRDDISRVRTPLRANTVLVSRMNTPALVGESAYIDRDYPELFLPDRIWMTVFQDGMESAARWIGFILTSPSARNYISLNATGTSGSMKNLPKKSLLSMPIASPNTLEEVNRITQVLIRFEMNGNETDSRLAKLRSIKTALMQDLLTGRKRVTELLNNLEVPI